MTTKHVLTEQNLAELITLFGGSFNDAAHFITLLRRKERNAAIEFIASRIPDASDKLKHQLSLLVDEMRFDVPMLRGKQFAVLYVAGATYGQIATMYGVKRSTVAHMIHGYITPELKAELSATRSKFTINEPPAVIAAYREILNGFIGDNSNHMMLMQGSVSRIALAIIQEYKSQQSMYQEDGPSAYDTLDDTPSRLSSGE